MKTFLTTAARTASLAALALSLASCGPDDGGNPLTHFSLGDAQGPLDLALQDSYADGALGDLLPAALPLLAGSGGGYGYAPSWDYASDDYFAYGDYSPEDPYDYYGYDDYYDDPGYYEQSPGSGDFMWLALAALVAGLIGDSPPDYGYDYYDGVQPWAWRTGDGYYRIVEPVYGGNRYYYYAPNMVQPFLVRDPYFSYGYRDDRLVALYDREGRVLGERAARQQRRAAERYYERARDLYRDSLREDDRRGVYARDWERRRDQLVRDNRQWRDARQDRAAWQAWDKRYEKDLQKRWQREGAARQQAARQFANWQQDAYRGPAPRFYAQQAQDRPDERRGFERLALVQPVETRRVERDQQRERAERIVPDRGDAAVRQRFVRIDRADRQTERRALAEQERTARLTERRVADDRKRVTEREQQARAEQQREVRQQQARAEQQREVRQQQARAEQQREVRQQQARAEQQREVRQQQARAEQQREVRQQQARAEQQREVRQQQARAEQQREAGQQQARAEQQRQARDQQARAQRQQAERQAQQQARAQQQQAERQAQQQARAQQQQAERQAQQQARAQQQQAERQAQQQARAQQQQAERQAQQQSRAQQQQAERQAQQQARAQQQQAERQAQQQQAQSGDASQRGGGRGKRDKG